jgi:hypothetical protein
MAAHPLRPGRAACRQTSADRPAPRCDRRRRPCRCRRPPPLPARQLFGLHANADISYYTAAAKALWTGLLDLQPRTGGAGDGASREEVVAGVARDIRSRLPEPFDVPLLRKSMGTPSPTQVRARAGSEGPPCLNEQPRARYALSLPCACSQLPCAGPPITTPPPPPPGRPCCCRSWSASTRCWPRWPPAWRTWRARSLGRSPSAGRSRSSRPRSPSAGCRPRGRASRRRRRSRSAPGSRGSHAATRSLRRGRRAASRASCGSRGCTRRRRTSRRWCRRRAATAGGRSTAATCAPR